MKKAIAILLMVLLVFSLGNFPTINSGVAEELTKNVEVTSVPENTLRIHYQRTDNNFENLGLWLWGEAITPSEHWPHGATPFNPEQTDSYGAYIDVQLNEAGEEVGFLVLNMETEEKDGGDKSFTITTPEKNEIWIKQGSDIVYTYEPIDLAENMVRIHYVRGDNQFENLGLWLWDDVANPSSAWPTDATPFTPDQRDRYGAYVDVEIADDADKIGFLVVNKVTQDKDGGDKSFSALTDYNRLWIKEGDDTVYISPYWETATVLVSGEIVSESKLVLNFSSTKGLDAESLVDQIEITDKENQEVPVNRVKIVDDKKVEVEASLDRSKAPYSITFLGKTVKADAGWKMIDELYGYEGNDLGATLHKDGKATLKVWSPLANSVSVILYDKSNQENIINGDIPMTLGESGVWEVLLNKENTGVADLSGYYYHYKIEHNGESKIALDPYAKSMATFNNLAGDDPIGKAAIVDPSRVGPELEFANIAGFEKREDAIIWEVHVRDFTSDPSIESDLNAQFGTFKAFIDKLDYIAELGVTHIQLLPIMSYFWGNEFENDVREMHYSAQGNNYNWGYDPHSYFSPSGMYSENPDDAALRIAELKELIHEIHKRDMGVVLDVVYNHTAKVSLFEDLVPNYYHFMDANGEAKTSFGGGRLGTTHEMARKVLVDSITYWVDEYKVDGFRFDMMGDHDAESIQIAYDKAKALNPNIIMIGEGWRTFAGDDGETGIMAADQDWMQYTESVGVFSDEFRNELKSGFGSEGEPRFITGGARNIQQIFDNIKAQPHNFVADDPGDVVPYIEAHDNLTLHDVIAQSIKKDPDKHAEEIHQRIRIGNAMVLTSQGTAFLHAGQEHGRTKQWRADGKPEQKETYMVDMEGNPFEYPYFIHDSYDSTDAINRFDWEKATNEELYPLNNVTREYTSGLIKLRRSTDAFTLGTKELVDTNITFVDAPEIEEQDLVIGYRNEATDGTEYFVFVNADSEERTLTLNQDLTEGVTVVDSDEAGVLEVAEISGFDLSSTSITIEPLTTVVIRVGGEEPVGPVDPENPKDPVDKDKENDKEKDKDKGTNTGKDKEVKDKVADEKTNNKLPKTATDMYTYILVGILLIVLGSGLYLYIRKRNAIIEK
ncbi:pullulanase [Sutcliffiella halmapala]|uniref:pullulanase n=1 Tax=Sutcliffiella halmapala TaxID=79882 RepID=UPI001F405C09|nr:pullulanase [Sutcliffiella halmapala]